METTTAKVDFIIQHFGTGNISRDGTNIAVRCPECGKPDEKRKFSICLSTWRCHCWVCGVKGKNIFSTLKKHRGIDAAKEYASKFKIANESNDTEFQPVKKVLLPKGFLMIAANMINKDPDFRAAFNYLTGRGVSIEKMWYHKIGTCISGGFWNRRIIFPSFDKDQNLNYYVSRSIDDKAAPKYLNAKADKLEIIFDDIRIDWNRELTIVEGVFDLIRCGKNSTCLLGSYMSNRHKIFSEIVKNKTPVLLALDKDVKEKTYKIAELLFSYDIKVRIMDTSGYDDVGEMSQEEFDKRTLEAYNYTGDSKLSFLISSIITSGSIF